MIIEEEVYLDHYGVKGMQWGVRKSTSARAQAKELKYGGKDRKKRTSAQKLARTQRTIKRANNAFAAAAAAIFIANLINDTSGGSRPNPNLNNYKKPSSSVSDVINRERKVKIDAINKTYKEGFLDANQRDVFVSKMNSRYDKKIKEAASNFSK